MGRILIGNIKGPQGAQGIQGPQGPVGATGPMGPMPDLINNALATQAGMAALDAAMGKTLQDQITKLNSEFYTYTADRIELGLAEEYGAWFRVLKIINVEIAISYSASTNEVLNTMLIRSYVVTEDNWTSWKAI